MTPTYYSVVSIATGQRVYGGTSLEAASEALKPGTVFGVGTAQAGATLDAKAKLPGPHKHRKHRRVLESV
jgi:hypothetical protein